jgi:Protein of unknown function (DUF2892)
MVTETFPTSKIDVPQNMGLMDRVIRSAIGGALVMNCVNHPMSALSKLGGFIGSAFLFYGVTGYDPLLKASKTSTLPKENQKIGEDGVPEQKDFANI